MADKFVFSQENVARAPNERGVYTLYVGNELIYIGRAMGREVTIRTRLQSHFRGDEGPCTQRATHYGRYVCNDPAGVEVGLLREYLRVHGRLPRCNARVA